MRVQRIDFFQKSLNGAPPLEGGWEEVKRGTFERGLMDVEYGTNMGIVYGNDKRILT